MNGKSICKELKSIRQQIADENGIPLRIPECTYQGPCRGTCPRCESEVRLLERELSKRISLGKAVTIAGIAVSSIVLGASCNNNGPLAGDIAADDSIVEPSLITGELVIPSSDDTCQVEGLSEDETVISI